MAKAQPWQSFAASQPYRVRESARAKRVCIKVSHLGEVEVVVPKGFNQRRIPEILQQRQDWIVKTTQRLKLERESVQLDPESTASGQLPEQICLRSLSEDWTVTYQQTGGSQVRAIPTAQQQLAIAGQVEQSEACQRVLQRWLSHKALLHFTPWLRQVSQEIELPCGKISVRGQKTRWASCSSQHDISLNYKLLFLPAPLVRYVFIHELCHTIHLNHSAQFWALVAEKEPQYKQLDTELRGGWRYVPEWVERSWG